MPRLLVCVAIAITILAGLPGSAGAEMSVVSAGTRGGAPIVLVRAHGTAPEVARLCKQKCGDDTQCYNRCVANRGNCTPGPGRCVAPR
jgi:hypothetical protein